MMKKRSANIKFFTGSEMVLTLAMPIIFRVLILSGGNAKLISSTSRKSYNSFGAAVDIGALYRRNDVIQGFPFGMLRLHPCRKLAKKLPLEILIGVSH
jgi:hypothetical protein